MSEETVGRKRKKTDERGEQCFAWGCGKRYKIEDPNANQPYIRSDSSGSSDEESEAKRKGKRSFHR